MSKNAMQKLFKFLKFAYVVCSTITLGVWGLNASPGQIQIKFDSG